MILLFDIDGTLILSGGAGRRAFEKVFLEVYGIPGSMHGFEPQGKTDTLITIELVKKYLNRTPSDEEISLILKKYCEYLVTEVKNSPGYRVLPGVLDALEKLHSNKNTILGLATGNIRCGAEIKLARADLMKYFEFGVYGDTDDRTELLQKAKQIGQKIASDKGINGTRTIVVGDTVRDVKAAREAGLEVVLVTTGPEPVELLKKAKPDLIVESLNSPDFFEYLYEG